MNNFFQKFKIIFSVVVLLFMAGLVSLRIFQIYEKNNSIISTRISSIEKEVAVLGSALEESNAANKELGEANKKQLQEIATTRRSGATSGSQISSQENLLTSSVAKVSPAVVSIVVSQNVPLLEVEYLNPFSDNPNFKDTNFKLPTFKQIGTEQKEVAAGSGFIIRSNGYVLTNKHVVSDTRAEYTVLLSSGEKKQAKVLHRDDSRDVAILKIDGTGYSTISLGDSSGLKLGQTVAAIGNALGQYNNSVSVGIVSGLDRTIEAYDGSGKSEKLSGIIQTDAAINRGSSGGPLLDLSGKAIGINVAMELGANNISFAIPINEIKPVISSVVP